MRLAVLVLLVAALALTGTAAAKGPLSGSVSGPGLAAPIELDGLDQGPWDSDSAIALLSTDTGIFDARKRLRRPAGDLGPRYDVRLVFPRHSTGEADFLVKQRLYPYAPRGPVVYTPPGQAIFDDATRTHGGWYRMPRALVDRLGLPARAPAGCATAARSRSSG